MKTKHYDYVEWLLYKNKELPVDTLEEMEEHLYNCEICLDIFLSLIDEKEIKAVGNIIPEDFTNNVMANISGKKIKKLPAKKENKIFNYQFGYYVAVASVTIFLTLGGFYTNMVDSVPKFTQREQVIENKTNVIANISNRIVNSTSVFIANVENINMNKEEK